MIIEREPINMNELEDILKKIDDSQKKQEIELFLKRFIKLKSEHIKKIKENLEKLDSVKMRRDHLVKIADILPEDASDLNKIFNDVSLNEDEINKILEIVKNSSQ